MTQQTVTSIVSSTSGSEMPSMPTWYRLWMTSIHRSLAVNCSRPSSRLKLARMPMPTAAVTRVVSSATTLIRLSSAFGISSTITMPTSGMKTASVSAQLSNQSIGTIPLESDVCE